MPNISVGMEVHQRSITLAVLPAGAAAPTAVEQVPNDPGPLRRRLARLAEAGPLQVGSEARAAGFVLQRALTAWGHAGTGIAPSLIPTQPGGQRKHDRSAAVPLARRFRAGELTAVRGPDPAAEAVRDLGRCRETLPRELLKSKPSLLKCLARRGLVDHAGTLGTLPHLAWLEGLTRDGSPLTGDDRTTCGEYWALFQCNRDRRLVLDRRIAERARDPTLAPAVQRLQCSGGATSTPRGCSPPRSATGAVSPARGG